MFSYSEARQPVQSKGQPVHWSELTNGGYATDTNQKRFQCEIPRAKRAVLIERKEALSSPVNKVDCVEGRRWFQSEWPMIRGVHPSEAMMHFPSVSDSPCFRKIFWLGGKCPKFYLFPKNFKIFIRQNFWWRLLVINHKFRIFPIFSLFQYTIPPYFDKILLSLRF